MFFDKLVFSNKTKQVQDEKNISHSSVSIEKEFEQSNLNIQLINKINDTIKFLIDMGSPKLMHELYGFMKNQIKTYNKYEDSRVLEITSEQLNVFEDSNISIEIFREEPFNVDSIVVYENKEIDYKYIDSELELNKFLINLDNHATEDKGLYFLTSYAKGYLGAGVYVCDEESDNSNYLFNNIINDKIQVLSRNGKHLKFLKGHYHGNIKKCILGGLEGIVILTDAVKEKPCLYKEELSLYGKIRNDFSTLSKDEQFNLRLQENLPEYNLKLSSTEYEICEDAKG